MNRLIVCPVCGNKTLSQDGKVYLDIYEILSIEFRIVCKTKGCDYEKEYKNEVFGL